MIIHFDGYCILNEIKCLFAVKFAMLQKSQTLTNSNVNWECQTCGNIVDANGNIVSLE